MGNQVIVQELGAKSFLGMKDDFYFGSTSWVCKSLAVTFAESLEVSRRCCCKVQYPPRACQTGRDEKGFGIPPVGFGPVWAHGWNTRVRPARLHTGRLGLMGSLQDAGGRFWEYERLFLRSGDPCLWLAVPMLEFAQNVFLSEMSGCSDGVHAHGKSQCSELTQRYPGCFSDAFLIKWG